MELLRDDLRPRTLATQCEAVVDGVKGASVVFDAHAEGKIGGPSAEEPRRASVNGVEHAP